MGQKTAGDLMFEQYLREHGYAAVEHEPDLGVAKRPDYVIERAGTRCVVEVKMFDAATRSFPDQPFGTTNAETVMKPVRSQLREAARQLKPLAGSGLPLVVLLTNPHEAMVFLDEHHMVYAMYGDPIVVIDIDPEVGGAVGDPRHEVGRNGRLARDHQYISAVAVLSEREHAADFYDEMNRRYADLPADARWERIEDATTRGERQSGSYHRVRVSRRSVPARRRCQGCSSRVHTMSCSNPTRKVRRTYKHAARRLTAPKAPAPGTAIPQRMVASPVLPYSPRRVCVGCGLPPSRG